MIKSKYILDILESLLDSEDTKNIISQIPLLNDIEYEYTGIGLYVHFETNDKIKEESKASMKLVDGVTIKSEELEDGAYAILHFDNKGIIDNLEIVANAGDYPRQDLEDYILIQEFLKY